MHSGGREPGVKEAGGGDGAAAAEGRGNKGGGAPVEQAAHINLRKAKNVSAYPRARLRGINWGRWTFPEIFSEICHGGE